MYKALTCLTIVCLLLCVPAAEGKNYAVLISAGEATTDDARVNSCFWYNVYLQYMTLLEEGYDPDDVYVLYGWGTDFDSEHACYQPPYPVTDYPVNRANIQCVFTMLAGIMTSSDFLYVWWMGHGGPDGDNLVMSIETTGQVVYDYEIENWVDQITDYDVRTFSWMTCHSGGILDNFEGLKSIVMSSATFYESTADEWLCDTWHAEFHYPERCAWAWETPCGICGPRDADTDDDGRVSFAEAFTYAEANTGGSSPQISDLGGLAPYTFLGGCSSQGRLALDQAEYACSDDAGISVVDCDLNGDDEVIESVTVTIDSTTEPGGETVLLIETAPASADFRGTIELNTSDAPGVLHISEGDVVTATYVDADDGQGGVNVVVTDTAVVDCTPPEISNVQTESVEPRSATVTFDTDEPAKGTVRYGFTCGALSAQATEVGFGTDHTVSLSELDDNTTYFYAVDAEDEAGNTASDDNGGVCYAFTTPQVQDYFAEQFSGDFDLENHMVTFIPDGSSEYYCACGEDAADFPTDPTGGEVLSLWDDDYSTITLSGGETVSLYGADHATFYVGSNGYITFGYGDMEYWPTLEWHFELPRISALFDDLYPPSGGTISWKQLGDRVAVTYDGVPEIGTSNSNTFQVEMFFDGTIRITWLSVDASFGISGLSEGNGLPPDFLESNLSMYGPCPCNDALRVSPIDGFSSSGTEGGPFTPECMTYTLANDGDSAFDWAAAGTQAWLDVDPVGGTLAPSDSAPVDVCINAYANSLPAGVYADGVTFTNLTTGMDQTRPVELTVEMPPRDVAVLNVVPSAAIVQQGDPVSIDVTVQNQGDLSETFDVTVYYGDEGFGPIPNGDFEIDPAGTSFSDISAWTYSLTVHIGNPPTGNELEIVDDHSFTGGQSVYSYLRTLAVPPWPGDSRVSQYLFMEAPVSTAADYVTLWVTEEGYTTSSRYAWHRALVLEDGQNTYEERLRCDCWGLNEGCTPNHYDYYDEIKTGADGRDWKRYTRAIPAELDKANLTVKIKHYQASWDLTQASSWYRLDNICFSDSDGNALSWIPIETSPVAGLPAGEDTIVDFTWDTTGVAPGEHVISAYAEPVSGEVETGDNMYVDGTVVVEAVAWRPMPESCHQIPPGTRCSTNPVCTPQAEPDDCLNESHCVPEPEGEAPALACCYAPKERYISMSRHPEETELTALRVRIEGVDPNDFEYWVDEPVWDTATAGSEFWLSQLVDDPVFSGDFATPDGDWPGPWGTTGPNSVMHVEGCRIAPGYVYLVQALPMGGDEGDEGDYSEVLALKTVSTWGDTVGQCPARVCTPANGIVGLDDVLAELAFFSGDPVAPLQWLDIAPSTDDSEPDKVIGLGDLLGVLDGFQGNLYPGNGPLGCGTTP